MGRDPHDGSTFRASALPFRTGADFSVFDHIKYLGVSRHVFTLPMAQRLFGQGAAASFDDMVVTIDDRG